MVVSSFRLIHNLFFLDPREDSAQMIFLADFGRIKYPRYFSESFVPEESESENEDEDEEDGKSGEWKSRSGGEEGGFFLQTSEDEAENKKGEVDATERLDEGNEAGEGEIPEMKENKSREEEEFFVVAGSESEEKTAELSDGKLQESSEKSSERKYRFKRRNVTHVNIQSMKFNSSSIFRTRKQLDKYSRALDLGRSFSSVIEQGLTPDNVSFDFPSLLLLLFPSPFLIILFSSLLF